MTSEKTVFRRVVEVTQATKKRQRPIGKSTRQKKKCPGCRKTFSITDFHRRKKGTNVRSSRCRYCAALAQRKTRLKKKRLRERSVLR